VRVDAGMLAPAVGFGAATSQTTSIERMEIQTSLLAPLVS